MIPESLKETREYINRCLDENGFFFPMERDRDKYRGVDVALVLLRMEENEETEEKWFNLPDREGASTWAKVAFPKGKVPENIEDITCSDCERPYFAEGTDKTIIKLAYLEEEIIKHCTPRYRTEFDVIKTFDMVGTKNGKVEIYFKNGFVPEKIEDIRCKRCQRPYLSTEDIEEIFHIATSEEVGKLNPPIYI